MLVALNARLRLAAEKVSDCHRELMMSQSNLYIPNIPRHSMNAIYFIFIYLYIITLGWFQESR